MKGSKSKSFIPPNVRVMFVPIIYIVILVVISVFAVRTGMDKIARQRRELKAAEKMEMALEEKAVELTSNVGVLIPLVTPATMALPDTNPSLIVISNFKSLIENKDIELEDFRVSGGGGGDVELGTLNIPFSLKGDFIETLAFLKDTKNVAPIIVIDRLSVSVKEDTAQIDASAKSYWASYPEKLPPVTQPIDKITSEEMALLQELTTKRPPAFFELDPMIPSYRSNPFSL